MTWIENYFAALKDVWLEAAPWLLIGLLAAGLIHVFVPAERLKRWIGRRGMGSVVRAALIGTPLPLCSCSVIPAGLALRRQGASKEATVSFMIATPENGADSIVLSYALLGPVMAVVRPVAAIASAVVAGGLTMAFASDSPEATKREGKATAKIMTPGETHSDSNGAASCCSSQIEPKSAPKSEPESAATSCCASKAVPATSSCCSSGPAPEPAATSCCGSTETATETATRAAAAKATLPTWRRATSFAFGRMFDDIWFWMLIGLLLAAAIQTFVSPDLMAEWGSGPLAYLAMLAIGIPMYICATASTPVAAAMWAAGVSPGAVLVFLLAGPATNLATMGVVRSELGSRALATYLIGVGVIAVISGIALDALGHFTALGGYLTAPLADHHHAHEHGASWWAIAAGVILAGLFARSLVRSLNQWIRSKSQPDQAGKTTASCCSNELA